MKTPVLTKWLFAVGASFYLSVITPALAGIFSNDFSSATLSGFTLNGAGTRPDLSAFAPVIEGGHLVLTYAENSEQGTIILDDLDPGTTNASFTATFNVRVGGGSSTPADGFAFFFGTAVDSASNFGEEGPDVTDPNKGITVSFDSYDNVDGDPLNGTGEAPAIDVKVNGVEVAHTPLSVFFMLSDAFTNVIVQLNRNGTMNVTYKGTVIYTNLFLPGYTPIAGGRFAIGGRTGGLNQNNWIDDLVITTTVAGAPVGPTIITPPQSQTVNERSSVSFSVLPDGTPPFAFQWFSNDVAIVDATNMTYTIASAANGARYKVQVTNEVNSVTSADAILTVNADATRPTISNVRGSETFDTVTVVFSEPVSEASATNTANYGLSGGLSISNITVLSPTTVRLATSQQSAGSNYTLTVNNVQDTAVTPNTIVSPTAVNFRAFVLSRGVLQWEFYGGIPGAAISDLDTFMADPRFVARTPDRTAFFSPFDTIPTFGNDPGQGVNFGARIRGFLMAPSDGDWRFFSRSDDASRMFISTDANPANLGTAAITEEPNCCGAFEEPGAGAATETSAPITLVGGQLYYFEALYKEGGGGDWMQVAWRKEGDTTPAGQLQPIGAAYLAAYADPSTATINITQQPSDATTTENKTATITAAATGSPAPLVYQWQRAEPGTSTFADIPGANSASYTTPILRRATDNGAKYRVVVSVPGGTATSAEATLTVDIDSTPPSISNVSAGENFKSVTVGFSEATDPASATNASNYSIPGLTVSAVTLVSANTVRLTTSQQAENTAYTLTISNVRDTAIPPNTIDPTGNTRSFTSLILISGLIKWEAYTGIGGTAVSALTGSPKYPNSPDDVKLIAGFDSPNGYGENFGGRMSGFVIPAETADYDFFIRSDDASQLFISTNDNPANLSAAPIAQEPGCCAAFMEPPAAQATATPIPLIAGQRYYMVVLYKEGGGGDYAQVAMRKVGDPTAADQLRPISGTLVATAVEGTVRDSITLPPGLASAIGSGDASKPGFKARIYQVDQTGSTPVATLIANAEQELAGIIGPNVANLTAATSGIFEISTVINWNQDAGGIGAEQGNFRSDSIPPFADELIPGIPGTGTIAHNTDSIAGEVITYVQFPTSGIYFMGVNSDDGFKVTASDIAPTNNGALVVTPAGGSPVAYHATSGGSDGGGVFRPITTPVTGKLVYASPADACGPLVNGAAIAGNIALIDRAVCGFSAKVQFALDAGAIAVVMVNSRDPGSAEGKYPIVMGGTAVDLPAVMISKPDGDAIKAALAAGQVNITITPDSTVALSAGAAQFNTDRGATDSIFPVNVATPGVYPLRLVWFEGGGGANLEWFMVNSAGQKILLNDTNTVGALSAYRARTFVTAPRITSVTMSGGQITIQWTGGGTLEWRTNVNTGLWTSTGDSDGLFSEAASGTTKFYRVAR